MPTPIDVSVLTPVLNEAPHIRSAVSSMQQQRFEGNLEFIFIDGRSDDDTVAILHELQQQDSRIRILDNPARWTPHALNIGLRHAAGTHVARMDAHTLYPPTYLAAGVRRLEDGDAAWVSGPQLPVGSGRWSQLVALALQSPLGVGGASFRKALASEIEVDSGFTGVWKRETLERERGWDEGWPVNQDGELAARIRASGGRILCIPAMAAQYVPRNSPRALARQYLRYGQYRVKTSRRHPSSMRRSHVLAPGLAASLLAALLGRGRLGLGGRAGVLVYLAPLAVTSIRLGAGRDPGDVPRLALVFTIMHVGWGFGFLLGCIRFGPPLSAIARLIGSSRSGVQGTSAG